MPPSLPSLFITEVLKENPQDYVAKTAKTTVTINQHLIQRIDDIADTIGSSRSSVISDLLSHAFRLLDLVSEDSFEDASIVELPLYSVYVHEDEDGDFGSPSFDPYVIDQKAFKDRTGIPLSVAYKALHDCRRYESPEENN